MYTWSYIALLKTVGVNNNTFLEKRVILKFTFLIRRDNGDYKTTITKQ